VTSRAAAPLEERSTDAFLGGRVTLVQPRGGHRAGLDAALLQALVPSTASGLAIDLGAGVGTVAFCLAARSEALSVIGVERDAGLVACGLEALALPQNASFANRVRLVDGDAANVDALQSLRRDSADLVVMNPPFEPEGRVSQSPDPRRRGAHVAADDLLQSWIASAAALLRPGGTLCLIYRADGLREVLAPISIQFGEIRVGPVHPRATEPAIRILVTAKLGGRAPLALRPGLVLHRPDGAWTEQTDAILRGRAEHAV
jgi:tRNA1(Val) A37 N6-methylase TrmN6